MARPFKKGLDYFPLDVRILRDKKFRKAKLKYGYLAVLTYIALICEIYSDEEYYIRYDEKNKDDVIWELVGIFQGKYQPDASTIEEIIAELVACGLFDGDRFNAGLLTSYRIQYTFLKATEKRAKIEIDKSIWLIPEEETMAISKNAIFISSGINDEITRVNDEITRVNDNINSQSKVNKTKVKESKVNNIVASEDAANIKTPKHKYGEYKNVLLTDEEYEKLKKEFPSDYNERIERLSEYIESKGAKYKSHLATIRSWARKDPKPIKSTSTSDYSELEALTRGRMANV